MPFSAHDVHVRSLRVLFLHPLTSLQTWSTLFGDFKQLEKWIFRNYTRVHFPFGGSMGFI